MMFVHYTKRANHQLQELPDNIGERIEEKIQWFADQTNPLEFAEPLKGFAEKLHRFRIGDYRAIFRIDKGKVTILLVLAVQHRREIYR